MAIQFKMQNSNWHIFLDEAEVLKISVPEGCQDSFEMINDKAFYWKRKTATPVTEMKLTLNVAYRPRYFQIPAVNYNGNGWGSGAQYSGYGINDSKMPRGIIRVMALVKNLGYMHGIEQQSLRVLIRNQTSMQLLCLAKNREV